MPKKSTLKNKTLNLKNPKIAIALVFVVVFGGLGIWKVFNSKAATVPNWFVYYNCPINAYGVPTQNVQRGSVGNCVKSLQAYVNSPNIFYNIIAKDKPVCPADGSGGLNIDGKFGTNTDCWVKSFQKHCIAKTGRVDGIVGPKTWGSLVSFSVNNKC